MKSDLSLSPNRLPWPPIIMAAAIALALALKVVLPLPATANVWVRASGSLLLGLGIALDLWAILTMRRAQTNILPHRPADRLVTWGPFALTRNPIYVGNTLSLFGAGLCFANLWLVPTGLVGAIVVDRLAIRREERHLAILFRETWAEYTVRVPRWLMKQTGAVPKYVEPWINLEDRLVGNARVAVLPIDSGHRKSAGSADMQHKKI